jgi:hypothetical protein
VGDVVNFGDEEAARERARDRKFDFEASIHSQLAALRELCKGQSITVTVEGRILTLPYSLWLDDLEKRLLSGAAALSFDEDPELGKVARVIPLKRREALPKSRKPRRTLEFGYGVPSDDYLKSLRLEREEAELAEKLVSIEKQYGKDQAEVFALLVGWC